jgi:hypothetical protein
VLEYLRVFGHVGFFYARTLRAAAGLVFAQGRKIMDTLWIIVVVLAVLFVLGGGGFYWSRGRG